MSYNTRNVHPGLIPVIKRLQSDKAAAKRLSTCGGAPNVAHELRDMVKAFAHAIPIIADAGRLDLPFDARRESAGNALWSALEMLRFGGKVNGLRTSPATIKALEWAEALVRSARPFDDRDRPA